MKKESYNNVRMDVSLAFALFGMESLILFLLTPLYTAFVTNVIYSGTVLPDIIRFFIDLLDTLIRSVGFAALTVAMLMKLKLVKYFLIYGGAILFRAGCALLVSLILYRSLKPEEVYMALTVLLIDVVLLFVVFFMARIMMSKREKKTADPSIAKVSGIAKILDKFNIYKKYTAISPMFPYLFSIGALLAIVKIATRTIGLVQEYFGSIFATVLGFCTDILVLPIAFLAGGGFLIMLYRRNERKKAISKLYEN